MPHPIKTKSGIFYLQVRVPQNLRTPLNKKFHKKSLKTRDPEIAKERFSREYAAFQSLWKSLRAKSEAIPHKRIMALAGKVYAELMEASVDEPGDRDAFMGFLEANPDQMKMMGEAAREWVMNLKTSGMDDVAGKFMEQADQFIGADVKDALDEAGFQHRERSDGGILVIIDGAEVPWNVAVRQQIIRFI